MNVELRHLRAFVAVAETLNFTRAAERLHIAQPSLSYTIRQLEGYTDLVLFQRSTRGTVLTEEGVAFLVEAREVLDRFGLAVERSRQIAMGKAGRLRVGYLIGAAVDFVPAILREFAARYPDVRVELTEYDFGSPNVGLDSSSTDVAIVRPPIDADVDVISTPLLSEPVVACMHVDHPLARRPAVSVAELLSEPVVAAPGAGTWRDYWVLSGFRTSDPVITYEAATFEAELQAVAMGRGISIMPATAPRIYSRPGVVFVPIADAPDCQVAVVRRRDAPRSAAKFAQLARRVVRDVRSTN